MRRLLGLCAVLLALSASAADPRNPYLLQAKVFYQGLDFEKCLKRLDQADKWENTTEQLAEIELYLGLCRLALGEDQDATEHFELALTIDDTLLLPPLQGPKVTALFEKVRAKVIASKPAPPPVVVKPPDAPVKTTLVPEPAPVVVSEVRERHFAVPVVLGAAAIVGAGVGIVFGVQASTGARQANAAVYESDAVRLGRQATQSALIANIGYVAAGVALVVAVVTYVLLN